MLAVAYGFDKKQFNDIKNIVKAFPNAIDSGLRDAVAIGLQKVVRRTPVDIGEARRSWGSGQKISNLTYAIISNVGNGKNYTPFLEFGTGIYGSRKRVIKPPSGRTWRFPLVKKNTIVKWISVGSKEGTRKDGTPKLTSLKGIKAHYMVRDTKKEMPQIIKDNILRTINELIRKANK